MEPIQTCAASAEEKAVLELVSGVVKAIHHINDGLDVLFFCHIYCIGISALGKGKPFHILRCEVHDLNISTAPAVDPGKESQYDRQKSASDQPFWIFYESVHISSSLLFPISINSPLVMARRMQTQTDNCFLDFFFLFSSIFISPSPERRLPVPLRLYFCRCHITFHGRRFGTVPAETPPTPVLSPAHERGREAVLVGPNASR